MKISTITKMPQYAVAFDGKSKKNKKTTEPQQQKQEYISQDFLKDKSYNPCLDYDRGDDKYAVANYIIKDLAIMGAVFLAGTMVGARYSSQFKTSENKTQAPQVYIIKPEDAQRIPVPVTGDDFSAKPKVKIQDYFTRPDSPDALLPPPEGYTDDPASEPPVLEYKEIYPSRPKRSGLEFYPNPLDPDIDNEQENDSDEDEKKYIHA